MICEPREDESTSVFFYLLMNHILHVIVLLSEGT